MKKLDNTVIRVLTKEHGKKVIEWWKAQGVDTKLEGSLNEKEGHTHIYNGVINGCFGNYSLHDVEKNNAKIIELPTEETEIPTLGKGVLMEVSCDIDFKFSTNRFVIGKTKEGYLAWNGAETENEIDYKSTIYCKYVRPIQPKPIPEYTIEELQSKLGYEFKIKK
jgi:hypothetical protein